MEPPLTASNVCRVVVSLQAPFQILLAEDGMHGMFGYLTSELVGQSILNLMGPRSDPGMFQAAIQSTGNINSTKAQFILQGRDGTDRKVIVAFGPYYRDGVLVGCHISFKQSAAITLQEAFEESRCPRVLVSSKSPHTIRMVNEEFTRKLGCTRNQALGQSIAIIQGSDVANWTALFRAASDGQVARSRVNVRAADGNSEDVVCVPVVEAPNSKVRHILIMFAPIPPPAFPVSPSFAPAESFHDGRQDSFDPSHNSPFVITGPPETASFFSCPNRRGFGPAIFPRRKVAIDGSVVPALPVVVTLDLLNSLHDLPLHKAAETIGVSATAFKKACRKLGVRRWTYKRRAGSCGRLADPEAESLADSPSPVEDDPCRPASAPPRSQNPRTPVTSPNAEVDGSRASVRPPGTGLDPGPLGSGQTTRSMASEAASGGRDSAASLAPSCSGGMRWAGMEDGVGSPGGPAGPMFVEPAPGDDSLVLDMLSLQWPMQG